MTEGSRGYQENIRFPHKYYKPWYNNGQPRGNLERLSWPGRAFPQFSGSQNST
jgi:hypothetical protein